MICKRRVFVSHSFICEKLGSLLRMKQEVTDNVITISNLFGVSAAFVGNP